MDNYTNDNQNTYGSSNGYPVDPNNNSYHYTGTENAGSTGNSYDSCGSAESSANTYSTYDTTDSASNTYSSYSSAQNSADQNHDRYYSPYERRTMEEGGNKKAKKPKKQHGFGLTVAKCACLAAVFGLVAGGVFGGGHRNPDLCTGYDLKR